MILKILHMKVFKLRTKRDLTDLTKQMVQFWI